MIFYVQCWTKPKQPGEVREGFESDIPLTLISFQVQKNSISLGTKHLSQLR